MVIAPPTSQPSFSGRVFEAQRVQARLGDAEPALVRARVLLAFVVVAAAVAPVLEALRWIAEQALVSYDTSTPPSPWPVLIVAIALGVAGLHRSRGGRSSRSLVAVALAIGAAVDLCAVSVVVANQEFFRALPVPSIVVVDHGVTIAVVWVVVAALVGWRASERSVAPVLVAWLSLVLIGTAAAAVVLPAFAIVGSIN